MQLDWKWLAIGGVLLLLLILFGNNPGEQGSAPTGGKIDLTQEDALVKAIEEHNKGTSGALSGLSEGMGSVTGAEGESSPGATGGFAFPSEDTIPDIDASRSDAETQGHPPAGGRFDNDHSRLYPGYLTHTTNPFARPPGDEQPAAPSPAQSPQNGYYPPPPDNSPRPQSLISPSAAPAYLAGGQPVRFFGSKVYTVDRQGKPVPLADGVYKMGDSRITLVVRDGHKMAIQ